MPSLDAENQNALFCSKKQSDRQEVGFISGVNIFSSAHFHKEDFTSYLQKQCGFAKKLALVHGAVPSHP
uniref:Uncharacterized protein n=1 Tax=Anguilla anguilla TaxID=7936 RepID=A0A0E9XIK9_ANGAN